MSYYRIWTCRHGIVHIIASMAVGAALLVEVSNANAKSELQSTATSVTPVTVSVVASRNVPIWNVYAGRLAAVERIQVRPRVAGAIQSVSFREGALVKQGDLLFTIDPASYQAKVAMAKGDAASAKAALTLATTEAERGRQLVNSLISQSEYDQRQSAVAEAQAHLDSAEAALWLAQIDLSYTQVRAPISGRVGKIEVNAGNIVAQGSASQELTTIVSTDPIFANFDASTEAVAEALSELSKGGSAFRPFETIPVEIGLPGSEDAPVLGKLQFVESEVDATTSKVAMRAIATNPGGRLLPGQLVRVRMRQPTAINGIVISDSSIGTDHGKKFVLVVDDRNRLNFREVRLGGLDKGFRIVDSGLKAGERIVTRGLRHLHPGQVVAVTYQDESTD